MHTILSGSITRLTSRTVHRLMLVGIMLGLVFDEVEHVYYRAVGSVGARSLRPRHRVGNRYSFDSVFGKEYGVALKKAQSPSQTRTHTLPPCLPPSLTHSDPKTWETLNPQPSTRHGGCWGTCRLQTASLKSPWLPPASKASRGGRPNDSFGFWAYSVLRRVCIALIPCFYEGLEVAGVSAAHSKSTGLRLQP